MSDDETWVEDDDEGEVTAVEMIGELEALVAGRTTLGEFQEWLVPATWNAVYDSTATKEVCLAIKLLVAEHTGNHRSRDSVLAEVAKLLTAFKETSRGV